MQESVDAIWKRHTDAATKGLETRAMWKRGVGLVPDAFGADDVYVLPSNYVTIPADEPLALAPSNAKPVGPALPGGAPRPALPPGSTNGHSETVDALALPAVS
jgi:hypothetical protein